MDFDLWGEENAGRIEGMYDLWEAWADANDIEVDNAQFQQWMDLCVDSEWDRSPDGAWAEYLVEVGQRDEDDPMYDVGDS
jgi:hypothetical protein